MTKIPSNDFSKLMRKETWFSEAYFRLMIVLMTFLTKGGSGVFLHLGPQTCGIDFLYNCKY